MGNLPSKRGRASWHYLYNRKAWKQLRLDHLARHPLCVYCQREGKLTPATVVDHIQPHKGNIDLFLDSKNLQSLCKVHHDSSKQRAEARQVSEIGSDANGFPLDPNHPFNRQSVG